MLHGHIKKDHFTSFFYCFGLYGSLLLVGAAAERTACSRAPRVTIELAAEDSAFFFFFFFLQDALAGELQAPDSIKKQNYTPGIKIL